MDSKNVMMRKSPHIGKSVNDNNMDRKHSQDYSKSHFAEKARKNLFQLE